ncbi:hypothetical protein [Bacillus paralicheniformis]|uniref:hypothetical protein n=1 Tax=Bacillus paralicheniformis TaxID=1648923 RepID=UPI001178BD7D|nr:hypothetical protein [Bacillus paralicheniformis]
MSSEVQEGFPKTAGIDYEVTEISIPVYHNGEYVETMEGKAYLKLRREEPYKNMFDRSQLDFFVEQWEVHAYSKALGKNVFMTLSDAPQPKNTTLANQKGKDYPATIVYNAIYDVYIENECVLKNQAGLGINHEIYNVPPATTINFQKLFEFQGTSFMAGACACPSGARMSAEQWEEEVQKVLELRN